MKINKNPSKFTQMGMRSRSIENNVCCQGRRKYLITQNMIKQSKGENINLNDSFSGLSTDKEQENNNILKPTPLNFIIKQQYFNIRKEYRNAKYVRCSSQEPQKSGGSHPQKNSDNTSKQFESQGSKKKSGRDQNAPTQQEKQQIVQPKKTEYLAKYGRQFSEEGLYLEALFYQLPQNGFLRHPITSSSPIISYFLIQLIVANKQPDQKDILFYLPREDQIIKTIEEILRDLGSQQRYLSLKQFLGQQGKDEGGLTVKMISYATLILSSLSKEIPFNYQLAIDDFIKYQQLAKPKLTDYYDYFENDTYGKNNLCFGFIRFCVQDAVSEEKVEIRLPIGKFDQDCVINLDLIDDATKNYFRDVEFFKMTTTIHSEKLMLYWIFQHLSEIENGFKLELQNRTHNNFQDFLQIWQLKQVYLEITSEKKVCSTCVDMFVNFPTRFLSDDLIPSKELNISVPEDFQLIIVTQYLYIPEVTKEDHILNFKHNSDNLATHKNRVNIYFEAGQVGLMTQNYVKERYTVQNNGLYNQEIDTIALKNTLFLSSDGVDDTIQSIKSLPSQQQAQLRKNNANIFSFLVSNVKKIQWGIKQPKPQKKIGNIRQQQAQQCYSLLKIIIEQQFKNEELPLEINLDFWSLFLRQKIVKNASDYKYMIQKNQYYITGPLEEIDSATQQKSIFDYEDLNIQLLLEDYGYFLTYCNTFSFTPLNNKQIQQFLNMDFINFGLFQITLILQDQSQESLQISEKNINNNFFQEVIKKYKEACIKLETEDNRVIQVINMIFTINQLSVDQKQQIERQLKIEEGEIEVQFYYSFFKKSKIEEIQTNESQFLPYGCECFQTRYLQQNKESQISLYDMDINVSSQMKYFNQNDKQEFQVLIQQNQ